MFPDDEFWMQQALALARQAADAGEVPVGAVVVLDAHNIGDGYNQPIASKDPTAHAEIVALRRAAAHLQNYRLPDTTLYVTIEPCTMCVGALIHARVRRLVFGAREPRAGAVCSRFHLLGEVAGYNHRIEVSQGILEVECSELISSFFKARRSAAAAR